MALRYVQMTVQECNSRHLSVFNCFVICFYVHVFNVKLEILLAVLCPISGKRHVPLCFLQLKFGISLPNAMHALTGSEAINSLLEDR